MNDLDSVMEKLKVQHKTLAAEAEKLPEEEKAVEPVKPAVSATPSGPTAGEDLSTNGNAAPASLLFSRGFCPPRAEIVFHYTHPSSINRRSCYGSECYNERRPGSTLA
mmetsp:Transcript_24038/g.94695  ORF Transcript_24038/g.94695 Transcript_24038/m.94695 type:complete len:108 (-) Transcript_24038:1109-1432(-)